MDPISDDHEAIDAALELRKSLSGRSRMTNQWRFECANVAARLVEYLEERLRHKTASQPPPVGGREAEATFIPPAGWVVLLPWVQNADGYWWRPHLDVHVSGARGQLLAEHLAKELNAKWMRRWPRHEC